MKTMRARCNHLHRISFATMRQDAKSSDKTRLHVVLYTRRGCHLCDDAQQILEDHGLSPMSVDIDADPMLRERFDMCVPVVEIDGKVRFRGRIDPVLLRRLFDSGCDDGEAKPQA
jgi:glutaredoxin